jgi:hypothetical protein
VGEVTSAVDKQRRRDWSTETERLAEIAVVDLSIRGGGAVIQGGGGSLQRRAVPGPSSRAECSSG